MASLALTMPHAAAAVFAERAVPLPPRRPAVQPAAPAPLPVAPPAPAAPPIAPPSPALPAAPVASADEVAACDTLLASGTIRAERLPPVGPGSACAIDIPVKLNAVAMPGASDVSLDPPVTLRCAMAGVIADWIRSDLGPLVAPQGGLAKLSGLGGYACRSRDGIAGAKLSEHALGNAMDIGAFELRTGRASKVTDVGSDIPLFATIKLTACARFSTVLGPGADAYHKDHMHVDIETRRNGRHFCQWQLP